MIHPEYDNDYYEVEKIIAHGYDDSGVLVFRVRWQGYGEKDDTWETEDCFLDPQFVQNYFDEVKSNYDEDNDDTVIGETSLSSPSGKCISPYREIIVTINDNHQNGVNANCESDHDKVLEVQSNMNTIRNDFAEAEQEEEGGEENNSDNQIDQTIVSDIKTIDDEMETPSEYLYSRIEQYKADWLANRANWKPIQVLGERKSIDEVGKEYLVCWQHTDKHRHAFHTWMPDTVLSCTSLFLNYALRNVK